MQVMSADPGPQTHFNVAKHTAKVPSSQAGDPNVHDRMRDVLIMSHVKSLLILDCKKKTKPSGSKGALKAKITWKSCAVVLVFMLG